MLIFEDILTLSVCGFLKPNPNFLFARFIVALYGPEYSNSLHLVFREDFVGDVIMSVLFSSLCTSGRAN